MSATRPIGNEHDDDELEVIEPADIDRRDQPGCGRCGGQMEGNRKDWIPATTTRLLLTAVAEILLTLDRSGPSLLVQIQQALVGPMLQARWYFTPYRIQLIESMILECLEDPRPLMRAVLGKDHRLIREADEDAARPPPESEEELANA